MTYLPSNTQKFKPSVNGHSLESKPQAGVDRQCGLTAISKYLGTPSLLTRMALEAGHIPGFESDGEWQALTAALEPHRSSGRGRNFDGPHGFPRQAAFARFCRDDA